MTTRQFIKTTAAAIGLAGVGASVTAVFAPEPTVACGYLRPGDVIFVTAEDASMEEVEELKRVLDVLLSDDVDVVVTNFLPEDPLVMRGEHARQYEEMLRQTADLYAELNDGQFRRLDEFRNAMEAADKVEVVFTVDGVEQRHRIGPREWVELTPRVQVPDFDIEVSGPGTPIEWPAGSRGERAYPDKPPEA